MEADESPESITRWLREWASGHDGALDALIPLVYGELRQMAETSLRGERGAVTNATSLVHDLFLQLVRQKKIAWNDRAHFFGICARILRQLLVARARRRGALKRGGGAPVLPMPEESNGLSGPVVLDAVDLIMLDEALDKLAALHPGMARIVELRYFAGFSLEDTAEGAGVSLATAKRHWIFARHWLCRELSGERQAAAS